MSAIRDQLHVYQDAAALNRALAAHWTALAQRAVAARGAFHIALAGGSTPRALYALLAAPEWRNRTDWRATHVYFGDERCVPPDHPDSNYGMARGALLEHVPIPAGQIHRIAAEQADAAAAAHAYDAVLRRHLPGSEAGPCFDLILLGLGADGHVASLFPDTPILKERAALAAAVYVEKLETWRISLTLPVINAARQVAILVAGAGKAEIVAAVLGEHGGAARYPVQYVQPAGGRDWFLDRAAAARLPGAGA